MNVSNLRQQVTKEEQDLKYLELRLKNLKQKTENTRSMLKKLNFQRAHQTGLRKIRCTPKVSACIKPKQEVGPRTYQHHMKRLFNCAEKACGEKEACQLLLDTLSQRTASSVKGLDLYSSGKTKAFVSKLVDQVLRDESEKLEEDNFKRTVASIYRGGPPLSQIKFNTIQRQTMKMGGRLARFGRWAGYKKTRYRITKDISIRKKFSPISNLAQNPKGQGNKIAPTLETGSGVEISMGNDTKKGFYQTELREVLIKLAVKLLKEGSAQFLKSKENVFHVVFGGDGYPDGKMPGTIFEVTLLEAGDRIHCPDNSMVVFGGAVKEDDETSKQYTKYATQQLKALRFEKIPVTYNAMGVDHTVTISFDYGAIVADQKMITVMSGTLSNSATCPSDFADIYKKPQKYQESDVSKKRSDISKKPQKDQDSELKSLKGIIIPWKIYDKFVLIDGKTQKEIPREKCVIWRTWSPKRKADCLDIQNFERQKNDL